MTEKKCTRCGIVKPMDDFHNHPTGTGGKNSRCKECACQAAIESRLKKASQAGPCECTKCKEIKPSAEFSPGYSWCRACCAVRTNARNKKLAGTLIVTEKRCACCKTVFPATDFHANRASPDSLNTRCKSCCIRGQQGPLFCVVCNCLKPRDSFRRHLKHRYRTECQECEQSIIRCSKCGMLKSHDQFTTDKIIATGLKSNCRQCEADYCATPEGQVMRTRGKHKRRTLMSQRICTLTGEEWRQILTDYGHCCAYCRQPFGPDRKPTQDHFVPVSKGGHHTKDNIVPACGKCNCSKYVAILVEKPLPLRR